MNKEIEKIIYDTENRLTMAIHDSAHYIKKLRETEILIAELKETLYELGNIK